MEPSTHHVAAPDSIAHLDGVGDGEPCGQQSHPPMPQKQPLRVSPSPQMAPPGIAKQARVPIVDGGLPEHTQLDTRSSLRTVQEAQITDGQQYDSTTQLFPSDTVNAQISGPFPENLHPVNFGQMPSSPPAATGETEVKQEPAIDDNDVFAAFTNEDLHDEEDAETKQALSDVNGPGDQVPIPASIKSEPDIGGQVNTDLSECADPAVRADHNTPTAHVAAPRPEYSSRNDKQCSGVDLPETEAFPKRVLQMTPESHGIASTGCFTPSGISSSAADRDYIAQLTREQLIQDSIQQSFDLEASLLLESQQSSADPVLESQQHGSMEAGSSLSEMNLMPINDNQSAQFWQQQRLQSLNTDPGFAKQARRMAHGPLPMSPQLTHVKGRQISGLSNFTDSSNLQSGNPSQRFSTSQPRVNTPYDGHLPRHSLSSNPPYAHPFDQRIPSGHGVSHQMSTPNWLDGDAFTSAGPIDPHNTQMDEGDAEMSEQSYPLMIDQSSGDLAISADSVIGSPGQLEDRSDNDASDAEPISWKLPSFDITYHRPEKPNDNHEAAVSIPNLVREHVALTDDHHQQEMQLFIEVFLPAQRALQTPDPEPAHAVINFHTISVMVLEAFVQWEIGDELGRGYGFHGGNTAMRPLPQGKEEDEPERIRSATDADVDEIFFAVVDRWRAGMLSDKGTLHLIRGCQEFCEIALDVIHYIKEHGLLSPEEKKRKERSDKGSVRGPKGDAEDSKGKRKADAGKVNNVSSRKKSKTEDKKGKKPVAKSKTKEKSSVVVFRK